MRDRETGRERDRKKGGAERWGRQSDIPPFGADVQKQRTPSGPSSQAPSEREALWVIGFQPITRQSLLQRLLLAVVVWGEVFFEEMK